MIRMRRSEMPPVTLRLDGIELKAIGTDCDFCGGEEFSLFWDRMRHRIELPTVFCNTCGLCQTNPELTVDSTKTFYTSLYNKYHKRKEPLSPESEYVRRSRRLAEARLETLANFVPRDQTPVLVYEVGAGVGQFQEVCRAQTKWQVQGVEPGEEQVAYCRSRGLDVKHGFFDEGDLGDKVAGAADVVVSFHVLEHFLSPSLFLRGVSKLLRRGSILFVEVPNLLHPGGSLNSFLQLPHNYAFTPTTICNYLRKNGFTPFFLQEKGPNVATLSRYSGAPPVTLEGCAVLEDVDAVRKRLRALEHLFGLSRLLPRLPLLGKVRGALESA
ncbi:MAG: class I SAM-dependent methyltransferase [Acidobacteria bacterium]|nr:class I SAM-dependent methyltransferase [Acidobacteriota bacterium]